MKLTSGVNRRIRQENALIRRKKNVETYTKMLDKDQALFDLYKQKITRKQLELKLKIAKREVGFLKELLNGSTPVTVDVVT